MIKVGIIGATGYAGVELLRILLNHPQAEISALSSVSFEGKSIDSVYPNLTEICGDILVDEETVIAKSDVVFASLPHGLSEPLAKKCQAKGCAFIDLGADFRLEDEESFQEWYGLDYKEPELHKKAVYCIPELHREKAIGAKIIGNPGCYPTSIALALAPALKHGLIDPNSIVIDSKSGVTGAGRGLTQTSHFPDCNEAFSPYKIASHRHTPEIEQTLSELAKSDVKITFVPHLLPLNRGIISTIYAKVVDHGVFETIDSLYRDFYAKERFVRVLPQGTVANLKNVRMSNYCDISLHFDQRTERVIFVSAIDNMVKGAAGQAIQNMNLICGLKEDTGLNMIPPAF